MANFTSTSSGDLTTYLGGKVLNAANMAKGEKNRREEANLERAQPGSLFGKALQSEFGGDLYSRTFGIFDPRKSHGETDRNSSKEARFTAQFPEAKEKDSDDGGRSSGSSQEVEKAKQDLLRDDEKSVPVQDKNLRAQFSKIFGSIDVKLLTAEAKIEKSSSKLSIIHQDVINTQKLILDQNAILETKFDQILEIFGKQIEFQKELTENAKIKAKENKLEEGQNLSTTRGLISTGTAGGDLSTTILGFLGRRLAKAVSNQVRKRLASKATQKGVQKGAQRAVTTVATRSAASAADNAAGKALSKSNLVARALRSPAVRKALVRKLGAAGAKKLTTKVAAKLIPAVSTAYGLGEGLTRIALGDVKGGFLSFGSAIPFAGYGFAAIDIFRDIDIDAYTKHIEPNLPVPSDENVGAFFAEALGVMPNQYEQGTARSRRGLASPGPAMLHGKEAILTPEDRRRITQFSVDSINTTGSKMVSTAIGLGDASGNGSTVRSIFNKLGVDYLLERVPFRFDVGKKSSGGASISSMFSDAATAVAGMVGMNTESNPNTSNNRNGAFTGLPQEYQKFYDYLVSKGASPNHAMGMVLNLARESSADPGAMANWNGTGLDSNGKPSGGLFQWNGPRFEAMKDYVGSDWATDWKGQLDFALVENDPTSGGYRKYSSINFSTPMAAAEWWLKEWERAADVASDMNKMRDILGRWKASGMVRTSSNGPVNWSPDEYLTVPSGVSIDETKEPGVDFTPAGQDNRAVFDGTVLEIKHAYNPGATGGDGLPGGGYGNHIIIRGIDPVNGKEFDALYAHFPDGELDKWKPGDRVKRGDRLGRMATKAEFQDPRTRPRVGSGTGPHTSLDFYSPGTTAAYPDWKTNLLPRIDPTFRDVPVSPVSSNDPSSLRSIEANEAAQEAAKLEAHRKRQGGGPSRPGYGKGGGNRTSATTPMMGGNSKFRNSNERRVYNALKSKSFTDDQISAIMANFDIETMGYTRMRQLENGPGRGLAQWEIDHAGNNYSGRWSKALEWYASKGKNPKNLINDIEGQIDWMIHEFTEIPTDSQGRPMLPNGYRYDLNDWKNSSKDPVKLASNFMNWYESPGTPHITQRLASAERYSKMLPGIVKQRKPNAPAGPKTIIESLKDDSGFSRFIPPALRNMIPGELQRRSSLMEDMEDAGGIEVQYVIINNAVAVNKPSSVNSNRSSSTTRSTSLSELHLASLGA